MKRTSPLLWFAFAAFGGLYGCGTTSHATNNEFAQPNSLMAKEIDSRVEQIPYQHREELYNNLLWLAQRGEQAIPSLLKGLASNEPKVRSSTAWVLGRIGDRRTIGNLQQLVNDQHETVRLEVARSLVEMGDVKQAPTLIAALDSEKVQVRAMCHDALKRATGKDFGYDHLTDNMEQRKVAVLRWRQWWSVQSNDPWFAQQYAQQNQIATPGAAPLGETRLNPAPAQEPVQNQGESGNDHQLIELTPVPQTPVPQTPAKEAKKPDGSGEIPR